MITGFTHTGHNQWALHKRTIQISNQSIEDSKQTKTINTCRQTASGAKEA